jgi:hypothetical protein
LALSPDGKTVLVRSWEGKAGPWTELFDIQSGKFVAHFDNVFLAVARRMDGTYLLVSSTQTGHNSSNMSAYSYENGELLGTWTIPDYGDWLSLK